MGRPLQRHSALRDVVASIARHHINILELWAIPLALKKLLQRLPNETVMVSCDNMSVVSYINKGGRTRRTLCLQVVNLLQQYLCRHITLHAIHLPGEDNILADSLSGKAGSVCISTCTQVHVKFVLCVKYFTCACKIFCFSAHFQSNISVVHATFIF